MNPADSMPSPARKQSSQGFGHGARLQLPPLPCQGHAAKEEPQSCHVAQPHEPLRPTSPARQNTQSGWPPALHTSPDKAQRKKEARPKGYQSWDKSKHTPALRQLLLKSPAGA